MGKKYIFIDTNIYVYCSLLTKDDEHNSELIEQLNSILKNNKDIILLVPEVVKLEYVRVSKNNLKVKLEGIKKLDNDISGMNSILSGFEKKKMSSLLEDLRHSTEENHKKVNSSLEKIFNSKVASLIEITPQILTDAYKRAIAGKKPFSVKKVEEVILHNPINADCVIFETILNFFKTKKIEKGDKLVFCTNNTNDFSNEKKDKVSPDLEEELPIEISFYSNFPKMIENEFKKKLSPETVKEYKNLTEQNPVLGVYPSQELCTIAITPNQMRSLNGLGVKLSTVGANFYEPASLGFYTSPHSTSTWQSIDNFSAAGIGQAVIMPNVSPLFTSTSSAFLNQQKCIACGASFGMNITDMKFYNKCSSCRDNTFLGDKITKV